MHAEVYAFVARQVAALPPRRCVVDLGGRDINGTVRDLFPDARYISVDLVPGRAVDVVADAATYEPEQAPDTVVCLEVLEHTPDAERIVRNALRMLASGGVLLVTAASDPRAPHSALDGGALRPWEHYRNVPLQELGDWLNDAASVQVEWHPHGDVYGMAVKA